MALHYLGENIPVFLFRKSIDRFQAGEGLETKFRAEAEIVFLIIIKRLQSMPHIPIVHIATLIGVRVVDASA